MKMKKLVLFASFVLLMCGSASAAVYTFTPTPIDLYDLGHGSRYTWGINWSVPHGEQIASASLFIDDLNNSAEPEDSDYLYIHLLNDPWLRARQLSELNPTGDDFLNQGLYLTTFSDINWYYQGNQFINPSQDFTYQFDETQIARLASYSSSRIRTIDGTFGLGLDPDCNFRNNGVVLTIETMKAPVPEPATMSLLGMGVLGLLGLKRKKA